MAATALDDIDALGADSVRSLVLWSRVAPRGGRPAVKAADPRAYPPAAWDPYDDLVRGTRARGLGLILSPSTPMPASGRRAASSRTATCKPDPKAYRAFVTALGRRYSGSYADENQGGGVLPRVTRWSLLNEPNQPGWLTPQYERKRGRLVATAAVVYRALARAGIAGLRASGHGARPGPARRDGADRAVQRAARAAPDPAGRVPAQAVLPHAGRRLRASKARGCRGVQALRGLRLRPPPLPARRLAAAGRAARGGGRDHDLVAGAAAAGARRRRRGRAGSRAGCRSTTPSSASRPTRPTASSACARRSSPRYLNQSDWMAYRDRRVRAVGAVQARRRRAAAELPVRAALRRRAARSRRYAAYRLPIWVSGRGARLRVYGQVRPAANGTPQTVRIQVRPPQGRRVRDGQDASRCARGAGSSSSRVPRRPGVWRLVWGALVSREARVAPR